MIGYINAIKRGFRDQHNIKPTGGTDHEPLFEHLEDGEYPMVIDGKIDYVRIKDNMIDCGNKTPKDAGEVSDGYHTFNELYDHRITLYIKLAEFIHFGTKKTVWRSKAHSDGVVWDGWFILGINPKPGEQITYHLPMDRWDECNFCQALEKAPEYDGHTSADVLERLKKI